MPKGPNGQKRHADVVRNIVQIMRIATGEEQETPTEPKATNREIGDTADKITRAKKKPKTR